MTLLRNWPRQRLAIPSVALLALAAIAWIAASGIGRPRTDGPLSVSSGYAVHARLAPGEALSWSVGLPFNHTAARAVIRTVDLVGVRGIDILAIVATYGLEQSDGSCLAAGTAYGFPPNMTQGGKTIEFPRGEIAGAVVPPQGDRTCTSQPSISVGVRGTTDVGGIDGVRVRYEYAGTDYEALLPWSLRVDPTR